VLLPERGLRDSARRKTDRFFTALLQKLNLTVVIDGYRDPRGPLVCGRPCFDNRFTEERFYLDSGFYVERKGLALF
jgi:hypothetical protein